MEALTCIDAGQVVCSLARERPWITLVRCPIGHAAGTVSVAGCCLARSPPLHGLVRSSRASTWRLVSHARNMSATRDKPHSLVDQLPEERLPVLRLIRNDGATGRRERAAAVLALVQ